MKIESEYSLANEIWNRTKLSKFFYGATPEASGNKYPDVEYKFSNNWSVYIEMFQYNYINHTTICVYNSNNILIIYDTKYDANLMNSIKSATNWLVQSIEDSIKRHGNGQGFSHDIIEQFWRMRMGLA